MAQLIIVFAENWKFCHKEPMPQRGLKFCGPWRTVIPHDDDDDDSDDNAVAIICRQCVYVWL